jgi:hypothetical protein
MPRNQETRMRCLATRPWLIQERDSLIQRYGPHLQLSIYCSTAIAVGLSAMGHIENGHDPTVSAAGIPDYGRVPRPNAWTCILWDAERRVLCLLSTPRLSDIEHVQWSKRNSRHLVYWHWSERIASAGQLGKFGVDVGTYTLWLLTPRSAIPRRGNAG